MTDTPLDLDAKPRARDLKPGDVLVWTGFPRPTDLAKVIDRRKDDDTGWWMTDGSGLADYVWDHGAAWTTVRALCDAADEVERLREDVEALHGLLSAGAIGTAPGFDSHRMVLAMRDHYKRQRDASRTAHAALVAGIETGLRESACAECDHDRCATYRSAASWVRDYAALDHHAPEWLDWATEKKKTHVQVRCPDCGLFKIWLPKE